MIQRRKRNSSKINLTISLVFHGLIIVVAFFFAAREGMLGKKLKQITVTMVPKEKKPEPPKEKPEEPKPEPQKPAQTPKTVATPAPKVETAATPPPATEAPMAAPAAAVLPGFEFSDGAKAVQSVSNPNTIYKGLVEHALRSRWDRPKDIADEAYVAEVELSVDNTGRITSASWRSLSGDNRWDASVKEAVTKTPMISRPPPKGFPAKFLVRFDVEALKTEDAVQLSSR